MRCLVIECNCLEAGFKTQSGTSTPVTVWVNVTLSRQENSETYLQVLIGAIRHDRSRAEHCEAYLQVLISAIK